MILLNGRQLTHLKLNANQIGKDYLLNHKNKKTVKAYRVKKDAYGLHYGDVLVWNEDSRLYEFKMTNYNTDTNYTVYLSKGYVEDDKDVFEEIEDLFKKEVVEDRASQIYEAELQRAIETTKLKTIEQITERANEVKEEIDLLLSVEGNAEIATALVALREQYWTLQWVLGLNK